MASSTMGLAGHGMLLAPACPCRVTRVDELLVIGRGYRGPLITEVVVKLGSMPATTAPTSSDGVTFAMGAGGPQLRAESGNLEEVVLRIDVGLGPGEWSVLAPGFWFDLPRGFVLFSPDPQTPGDLPELHHGMNLEAMIVFARAGRAAGDLVLTAPGGEELAITALETPYGDVRVFAYEYDRGDAHWIQHRYVLPYADDKSIVMTAQAPSAVWADVEAAADQVACSFEPTG